MNHDDALRHFGHGDRIRSGVTESVVLAGLGPSPSGKPVLGYPILWEGRETFISLVTLQNSFPGVQVFRGRKRIYPKGDSS